MGTTTRVCHSRERGNPCVFVSLVDSRVCGNDRKLNGPGTEFHRLTDYQPFAKICFASIMQSADCGLPHTKYRRW